MGYSVHLAAKDLFMQYPTDRIVHNTVCDTQVVCVRVWINDITSHSILKLGEHRSLEYWSVIGNGRHIFTSASNSVGLISLWN